MQEDWNIILSILDSPDKSIVGQQRVFSSSPIILGREDKCDLIISDPSVSRNHSIIRITNDYTRVFITDMSTYGTEVSGKQVPKGRGSGFTLNNGDTIKVGTTVIRFELKLKSSVQSTMVGESIDRSFLDSPPPSETPPEKISEFSSPKESQTLEEAKKGLNPIYIGIIIICILFIIYLAFFSGKS